MTVAFSLEKLYNFCIMDTKLQREIEVMRMKKKVVVALGHRALGTTLPEQQIAVRKTVKSIADLVQDGYQVVITHSNAPQLGMIHTAMNEFGKNHPDYTPAPMSVCSAMTQGYVGFDLQNAIREELLTRGIYRTVSTILTQVTVDPYDEAFYTPTKVLGRYMSAEDAAAERKKRQLCGGGAWKGVSSCRFRTESSEDRRA